MLPTLAALTPSDVEVVLTDENVEPIDFDEKIDLVVLRFSDEPQHCMSSALLGHTIPELG